MKRLPRPFFSSPRYSSDSRSRDWRPAGAAGAAGVYTAAQAQAGQRAYAQQCAGCHGQDFRGSADAPALEAPTSATKWGPRAANELFTYLVQTMPPTNPGALGEEGRSPSPRICSRSTARLPGSSR